MDSATQVTQQSIIVEDRKSREVGGTEESVDTMIQAPLCEHARERIAFVGLSPFAKAISFPESLIGPLDRGVLISEY